MGASSGSRQRPVKTGANGWKERGQSPSLFQPGHHLTADRNLQPARRTNPIGNLAQPPAPLPLGQPSTFDPQLLDNLRTDFSPADNHEPLCAKIRARRPANNLRDIISPKGEGEPLGAFGRAEYARAFGCAGVGRAALAPSFDAQDRSQQSPNVDEAFARSPSPRGRGRGEGEGMDRFSIASAILQSLFLFH
jgi:hypothetical protein